MQEFGSSSSIVMVYDHLHVHYVHMYAYIYMTMSQSIIIPYCTCNIYEPQQYTQNQRTPIRILPFLAVSGSLTKTRQTRPRSKNSAKLSNSCNLQLPILQPAKKTHLSASGRNRGGMCLPGRRRGLRWNVWGSNQESFFCWLVMVLILDVSLKNVI